MASKKMFGAVRQFSTSTSALGKLVKTPVSVYGVTGRYASALYSAASKEKSLDKVVKEVAGVQDLLAKDAKFDSFIHNPTVKRADKTAVLQSVLGKQGLSKITVNFFAAMAENGRLGQLKGVLASFDTLMAAHRGEVVCSVTTAKPLSTKNAKELETALNLFLKPGQTLKLTKEVDASLIGGMVVNIGDKFTDMSTASKIKTYTELLQQTV